MALPRNYDAKAVEENGKRVLSNALQPALKDHGHSVGQNREIWRLVQDWIWSKYVGFHRG